MGPSLGWALGCRPPAHAPGPVLRSSSGKVALYVPVKLGIPMFKYLVTSFR